MALIADPLEPLLTTRPSPCRQGGCTTTATTTGLCSTHEAAQDRLRESASRRHHVVALPALRPSRPTWHDLAACRGRGPAAFYPGAGVVRGVADDPYRQAIQLCSRCPVRAQCAEAGAGEVHGVWGGQTPAERGFGVRPVMRRR